MNEERKAVEEGFYQRCAELLGVQHTYKMYPYTRRTRWNNRTPGNGRFIDRGLIRMFSPTLIQVALTTPRINKTCKSMQEVYDLLQKVGGCHGG